MSEVSCVSDPEKFKAKEQAYIETRRKEGRLLEDKLVAQLPIVARKNPHWREWRIRARSFKDFIGYWRERGGPLRLLDLGCGSGWMSRHLAKLAHSQITGMDLNQLELDQAARVFGDQTNLRFIYGDIFQEQEMTYDCILLAATMQYFSDPKKLIPRLLKLLDPYGEIHIIDTRLYRDDEVEAAQQRSKAYYQKVGQADMASYYFHHRYQDLIDLGAEVLHDPKNNRARWRRLAVKSPFYWLRFRKQLPVV